jgi:putative SOS response-associated peptidase YedK
MCGRYELHSHPAAIALAFGLPHPPSIHPRYNMAPMQNVPIVRVNAEGQRELVQVRWGLVPRWARDPSIAAKMINARAETVMSKPSYRNAFRRHRCLVPADGFYEWMPTADGHKQPVLVARRDGSPFGLAGLYERWLSPEGDVLDTCTIITTGCNDTVRPVHDRMPVIVSPGQYARWLDPAEPGPEDLLGPCPAQEITFWPVSTRVNNVRHDDASLIERIDPHAARMHAHAHDAAPEGAEDPSEAGEEAEVPVQPRLF